MEPVNKKKMLTPNTEKKKRQIVVLKGEKGMSRPGFERLARRAGHDRIRKSAYEVSEASLRRFLDHTLKHAINYRDHARRKTIDVPDVVNALTHQKIKLYT